MGIANLAPFEFDSPVVEAGIPATPASGLTLYCEDLGGRDVLAIKDKDGMIYALQPGFARNKLGLWMPTGNNAAVPIATGLPAPSIQGTSTARNVASTNLFTSTRRHGQVSASTTSGLAEYRQGVNTFWRGNATGLGGFYLVMRFGTSDAASVTGARMFCGLTASANAGATNVQPDTLTDSVGVCQISTSNNLQIMTNDSAGTATKTDLGANFPANTLSVDLYEVILYCATNASNISYKVKRVNTGHVATGNITTDLPTAATFMGIKMWRTNNATALAVGIDMMSVYIETDN